MINLIIKAVLFKMIRWIPVFGVLFNEENISDFYQLYQILITFGVFIGLVLLINNL